MKNKVAIVCGSSCGMGRAIAEELFMKGAKVTICARNQDKLFETMRILTFRAVNELKDKGCDKSHNSRSVQCSQSRRY